MLVTEKEKIYIPDEEYFILLKIFICWGRAILAH
jgi:hypothetical protein